MVALSEFYSLNQALVPQHVVFEIDADELGTNTASTLRTLANVREMGFQLCLAGLGAQFTTLELIAEASPDFLCLDPVLVAGVSERADAGRGRPAARALRRPHRRAAGRHRGARRAEQEDAAARATAWSSSAASSTRGPTRACRTVHASGAVGGAAARRRDAQALSARGQRSSGSDARAGVAIVTLLRPRRLRLVERGVGALDQLGLVGRRPG